MKLKLQEGLKPFLPEGSLETVMDWLSGRSVFIRITRGRRSKLGDYRPPQNGHSHRISINCDLSPHEFLITLTHEIAHLNVWEHYGRKAQPHGKAWKTKYAVLLDELLKKGVFPEEMQNLVRKQVTSPRANSHGHAELVRLFREDKNGKQDVFLEDLPAGARFKMPNGRVFRKEEKLRKWYRCISLDNNRPYRISPVAVVVPVEN